MASKDMGYKKFTKKQRENGRIKAAEVNRARGAARRAAKAGDTVPF
jgi:hypothetical protein